MPLNTIPNKGLTSRGYPSDRLVTPIIINGDMSVAQRGTSVSSITTSGYRTVDRFRLAMSSAGTWTSSQDTDVPSGQGFANSLKLDCTVADGSLAASDYVQYNQFIEGQNLQLLKWGTSSAESLTLSFWVKSNKTGTYIAELRNSDNTRTRSLSYSISASNTWEKKIIIFGGDTNSGPANDNGEGLRLTLWLAAGSDYSSGTLATDWETTTQANRAVGQVNLADDTANNFWITGVQLEVGEFDSTTIPSFPFESYESNLRKCMRYYENFIGSGTIKASTVFSSTSARCYFEYKVKKRTTPTVTIVQSAGNGADEVSFLNKSGGYVTTIGSHEILNSAIDGFDINTSSGTYSSTGWQDGYAVAFYTNGNDNEIWNADAEL